MKHIPVLIWKEGDSYVSRCPATSVSSYGDTEAEAIEHHTEAMELFFEDMSEKEIEDVANSMPATIKSTTIPLKNFPG